MYVCCLHKDITVHSSLVWRCNQPSWNCSLLKSFSSEGGKIKFPKEPWCCLPDACPTTVVDRLRCLGACVPNSELNKTTFYVLFFVLGYFQAVTHLTYTILSSAANSSFSSLLRYPLSFVPSSTPSWLTSSSTRWWSRWFQHSSVVPPKCTVRRRLSPANLCTMRFTTRSITFAADTFTE